MRLRSLLVCPCWRCREARREERDALTPEEIRARLAAFTQSGYFQLDTRSGSVDKWRKAIESVTAERYDDTA